MAARLDEVPGVGVVGGAACDDFGGVEDGASRRGRRLESRRFSAVQRRMPSRTKADLRIWLDAREAVAQSTFSFAEFLQEGLVSEEGPLFLAPGCRR